MKRAGYVGVSTWAAILLIPFITFMLVIPACGAKDSIPDKEGEMAISLSSSAFKEGDKIPVKYTCEGQDVSPPLEWGQPPAGTQSLALIVDDPDAPGGVFTHWVIFNIPSDSGKLPEAIPTQAQLPDGALQGKNDFGRTG